MGNDDDDYLYTKFSFKHLTHRLEHLQCTNLIDNDRFVKDICPLARVALDASVKIHGEKNKMFKKNFNDPPKKKRKTKIKSERSHDDCCRFAGLDLTV